MANHGEVFKKLGRGIERETLRYHDQGKLSTSPHPKGLGSPLTNKWITTDYSESLLEFITPVSQSISTAISQLNDIHHFSQTKIGDDKLWPLSMPCYVESDDSIELAQYGSSNTGKMKTLYRQGLKHRYGSLMQIISGVHFNFSFPEELWDGLFGEQTEEERQESKSDAYFGLIRNYYRFGWLIPYFFGASPALCSSFVAERESLLKFEKLGETLYLPYATSLRLSDLGYTNNAQSSLKIGFNSIDEYLQGLNKAIRTPSEEFAKIGVKVDGEYRQLNSNVLQIENELYAPIRPKRVTQSGEKPSEALERAGVEYIEVRSLDVNPFSPVGINEQQIRFLDLFLTWCLLTPSDSMDNSELECWRDNWNKVIIEGRNPGLELKIGCKGERLQLSDWAHKVFDELEQIASVMDSQVSGEEYTNTCFTLRQSIDNPEQTISGQLLKLTKELGGLGKVGRELGDEYYSQRMSSEYETYSEGLMEEEVTRSIEAQRDIEKNDSQSFDEFLADYFSYLKDR